MGEGGRMAIYLINMQTICGDETHKIQSFITLISSNDLNLLYSQIVSCVL